MKKNRRSQLWLSLLIMTLVVSIANVLCGNTKIYAAACPSIAGTSVSLATYETSYLAAGCADPILYLSYSAPYNQIISDVAGYTTITGNVTVVTQTGGADTLTVKKQMDSAPAEIAAIFTDVYPNSPRTFTLNIVSNASLTEGSHTLKLWVESISHGSFTANYYTFKIDRTPPSIPSNLLQVKVFSNSVTLSWTASSDNFQVKEYEVYNGTALAGTSTTTSYTVQGLEELKSYSFTVRAKDSAGNVSNSSNPLSITTPDGTNPSTPTNLTVASKTVNSITLSWTASTDNVGVTGYDIYNGSSLAGSSTTTSYTVTGLSEGTSYSFSVKAKDAAGNVSGASNAVSATTQDSTAPTAPTSLSIIGKTSTSVSLTWTASTDNVGVVGYDVYNGTVFVGSTTSTNYTVTSLSPNITHTFTVKARDAASNVSAASNAVNVITISSAQYFFDSAGRLDYILLPTGQKIKYQYDGNGNQIKVLQP